MAGGAGRALSRTMVRGGSAAEGGKGTIEGMIVHLDGTWRDGYLEVGGVGYDVETVTEPERGAVVSLHVRSVWREGSGYSLYGFTSGAERDLFDAMCKVTKVGPAAAMSVLRTHGLARACAAIVAKDPNLLTKTPGVGKKTAELIVGYTHLDAGLMAVADADLVVADDVAEALVALGYEEKAAREASKQARMNGHEGEEQLREALRLVRGAS